MSIFTSTKNSFEGQLLDEKVIFILRRHWFVLVPFLILGLVLIILPFGIYLWLISSHPITLSLKILSVFLAITYLLVYWQLIFYWLMIYWLDAWIVTNKRIIDSRQLGFFRRRIEEINLNRIQDISVKTEGFFPTILNFGDLDIQTAGTEARILFLQIPDPNIVKNKIMEMAKN